MNRTSSLIWTYFFIGKTIFFPLSVAAEELSFNRQKEAQSTMSQHPHYILKKGDTLSSVVRDLNLDVADLFALNPEFAELHMWKEGAVLYLPTALPLPSLTSQGLLDIPTLAQTAPTAERITKELATQGYRLAKSFDTESKNSHSSEKEKSYWSSRVKQHFEQEAKAYTERFLGGKGSARMQVSLDNNFNLNGLELGVLASLYENEDTLVFSQVGAHRKNDRTIVNLGVGRREFNSEHMFGYNSFFDYDVTRSHRRLGAGIEYWQDHLKLGGNLYLPLSSWKDSPDFDFHEERPARGIDMRAQAYLPSLPQLSGKLSVERYWGEKVDLLGTQKNTHNPYAITAGVEYQPMPLIKFTADQTLVRGGQHDTQVGIGIEWRLGASLSQMMTNSDPDRSLQGMRYDQVERNNNIVLEYRDKAMLAATLSEISGHELQPLTLSVNVQSGDPLAEVIWFGDVLGTASGISQGSNTSLTLLSLPAASADSAKNIYPISVLIRDIKGREARADGVIKVIEDNNIVMNFALTVNGSSDAVTVATGQRYVLDMVVSDPRQTTLPVSASLFDVQTPELQYKVGFEGELSKYVVKDGDAFYLDLSSVTPNKTIEGTAVALFPSGFEIRSNKLTIQTEHAGTALVAPADVTATFGDAPVTAVTTGGNGGPLSYSSSNTAVVAVDNSGLLTFTGAGTATITVTETSANYAAQSTTFTVTVTKATATALVVPADVTATFGDAPVTAVTTGGNGGPLSYSSSNTAVVAVDNSGLLTFTGPGTATISVTEAASGNYASQSKTFTVTVNRAAGTALVAPADVTATFGDSPVTAAATGGNGGILTYSSSNTGVVTVNNSGLLTFTGAGTATITVTETSANYTAQKATFTVTVNRAAGTALVAPADVTVTLGAAQIVAVVTGGNGGTLTYSSSAASVVTVNNSGRMTFTGAGTATITVTEAASGNYASQSKTFR
ncbi:inverse autotransporter beta domain-containing protein, partial [Aeromonas veronii]|uniref:inverse autotransporter beta domain-containing protein n=1 Tax=Aeromonas veronii TaxID=654 RepID=UPI0040559538